MRDLLKLICLPLFYLGVLFTNKDVRNLLVWPYAIALVSFLLGAPALVLAFLWWGPDLSWWWDSLVILGLLVAATSIGLIVLLIGIEVNFDRLFKQFHSILGLQVPREPESILRSSALSVSSLVFRSCSVVFVLLLNIFAFWTPGLNILVSIFSAVFLAFDFYVAPCQARGKGWRWQLRMMASDSFYTLCFGYVMLLYLSIPVVGIFIAPAGHLIAISRLASRSEEL